MTTRAYVAVDLGAESGRVIVGTLAPDGSGASTPPKLELHELHRFTHEPISTRAALHWNVPHLWSEILAGLRAAASWAKSNDVEIASIGVDAWGVDFVLLNAAGEPLGPPRCYRDPRHESGLGLLRQKFTPQRLYQLTGVQEMSINTLAQLAGAIVAGDDSFRRADRLLLIPDYFHLLLSGQSCNESTIASTSQLLDASTGTWSQEILSALDIHAHLFQTPIHSGTRLGRLRPEIAQQTGLPDTVQVIPPGSHDTASAIAGVPAMGKSWAYLSSGTWSLMGMECSAPILTDEARLAGFTQERGVCNTIRCHKNLIGLWLVQELRRDLERRGTTLDYAQLTAAASAAQPFRTRIDAAHPSLAAPGDSIDKLKSLARAARDPEPATPGELTRCCLEALAMAYRRSLDDLESLTGDGHQYIETIHIVGGGSKNTLLNQMAADATGRRILAGPAEATAAGNLLVQAMADRRAGDLASIRAIVARSFELVEYTPKENARWNAEYLRHRALWEKRP